MSVIGSSHAVLSVAYLVVALGFLRDYRRFGDRLPLSVVLRYAVVVLLFGLLAHAGELLSWIGSQRPALTLASLLAALMAPVLVLTGHRADRTVVDNQAQNRVAVVGERFERLKARLLRLEDLSRRNSWLHQSRQSMSQLNDLLFEGDRQRDGDSARTPGIIGEMLT